MAWIAAGAIALVLLGRAGFVVIAVPYLTWLGFREGGYPAWAQALAVATIGYGLYRSITDARRRK